MIDQTAGIILRDGLNIQLGWAGVGIIAAILGHASFTIWTTATFKTTIGLKIDGLVLALHKMDKELEKRDSKIQAAWNKIDNLSDRMVRLEAKNET